MRLAHAANPKRRRAAIGVLALALVMSACGGSGGDDAPASGSGATPPGNGSTPPSGNNPSAPTYRVGGSVSGLRGSGLTLTFGSQTASVLADGTFTFPNEVANGTSYSIAIQAQPSSPSQTCTVANAQGTVRDGDALSTVVTCATHSQSLQVSVIGLRGSGLVLANGTQSITPSSDGAFNLGSVANGDSYSIAVISQPTAPSQTCTVERGTGTVGSSPLSALVRCSTNRFAIALQVTGLAGTGLVLQDVSGNNIAVAANGTAVLPTAIESGTPYSIAVVASPANPAQTCVLANASGTVESANVSVDVTCTTNRYRVRGIVSGLVGSGLALRLNATHDIAIGANGPFAFDQSIPSGDPFHVAVPTQPSSPPQTCAANLNSGTVAGSDIQLAISCTTNSYIIRGTVSGLVGSGFVLASQPGGFVAIPSDGAFEFPTPVPYGTTYSIDVNSSPTAPRQSCNVNGATGTVLADVAVTVECKTDNYLYALVPGAHLLRGFTVNSNTGSLLPLDSGGSFATGTTPTALAIDPLGTFLYVVNYASENLSGFRINPLSGELSAVPGSPYALGSRPTAVAIDATASFVYVANFGDDSISAYALDRSSGALAAVSGSPFSVSTAPVILATHPQQQRLYVLTQGDQQIRQYSISANGALSPTPGSYDPGSLVPHSMVFDASGARLYTSSFQNQLRVHDVQPDGSLLSATYAARHPPAGIALHPQARFALVPANAFVPGMNLSVYSLDAASGAPTEIVGSPYGTANFPKSIVVHPEGTFVYVADGLNSGIYGHAIDVATGQLTLVGDSPFDLGQSFGGIAIRKDTP